MMCHGHTQTGKMTWDHTHNSRYSGRCYQLTCTMKRPCKSSVMPLKCHMVLVSIWCQSKITSSPQPSFPQLQDGASQTLNSPSSRALNNTHLCQTSNSGQEFTIKFETRTEHHLSIVFKFSNRPLMDQDGSRSMAHILL